MTAVLYRRERELLVYIMQFQEQHGYSPTLREMADAMGRNSVSTIHALIRSMVEKGYLQKVDGNNRTLKVLNKESLGMVSAMSTKAIGPTITIPLMGFIAAGKPLEPHTDPEATLAISSDMISGKRTAYALQVKGTSMIEDGILDGDNIIVEKTNTAKNGDIVVAYTENGVTLKKFYKEGDRVVLRPANSEIEPIYPKELAIQGVAVSLVRRFNFL